MIAELKTRQPVKNDHGSQCKQAITTKSCESGFRLAPELLNELGQQVTPIVALLNRITIVYKDESKKHTKAQRKQHHELMRSIQNIAKQARIVSVNAQIVAARAGEIGRELAVIASELTNITAKIDKFVRVAVGSVSA